MDTFNSAQAAQREAMAAQMKAQDTTAPWEKAEVALANLFKRDLGVEVNPQALRMFIRCRFDRLSPLAHKIHRGDP